jgi:hypothetical protein
VGCVWIVARVRVVVLNGALVSVHAVWVWASHDARFRLVVDSAAKQTNKQYVCMDVCYPQTGFNLMWCHCSRSSWNMSADYR